MNNKDNRIKELDVMKFLGIIFVVIGHVTRMYTPQGFIHLDEQSDFLILVTHMIYSFHMPMFVFVSGLTFAAITLRGSKYQNFWKFIIIKVKRLMIPYFAFAFLWVMPFMVGFGFSSLKSFIFDDILLSLDSRHLWYVWMLFNVFILFTVFKLFIEKLNMPSYSFLIVSFLLYYINIIWGGKFIYFQVSNAFEYQLWFTIGYMAYLYKKFFLCAVPLLLFIGVFLYGWFDLKNDFIIALGGTYFFYVLALLIKDYLDGDFFRLVSTNSFGIYLFHPIIIYLLFYYLRCYHLNPYVVVWIVVLFSFFVSLLLTEITRKFHLQILIGEKSK